MGNKFTDGIKSFVSSLVNQRTATAENGFVDNRLGAQELRAIYKTGLGNKIVRLKAGYSLDGTLQFESKQDELYYNKRLAKKVKNAAKWMVAMGRGVIVLHHRGDDLTKPLGKVDPARVLLSVFSGDMTTAAGTDLDLQSERYMKPLAYNVRGVAIHHSRVVDFTYVEPPELDAPYYQYGGISEFELIYEQLIADGVVQRASPRVIEKASTLFYKVRGFREHMSQGKESEMVTYFSRLENVRGIMAAGIIDADDELEVVSQQLSNLSDADQITLRRLAMVTGLSITRLVGENVKGLNSSGDNESDMDQSMIETIQSDYLIDPINELMTKCGQGAVVFKENQGETASDRIEYETKALANAQALYVMGEDNVTYLRERGVVQPDDFDAMFAEEPPVEDETRQVNEEGGQGTDMNVDPQSALNGAQVTALLEVIRSIRGGEMSKPTAEKVLLTSFPISAEEARRLLADVPEGANAQ